eukprot:4717825-Amphidinium_carterae.1
MPLSGCWVALCGIAVGCCLLWVAVCVVWGQVLGAARVVCNVCGRGEAGGRSEWWWGVPMRVARCVTCKHLLPRQVGDVVSVGVVCAAI